MGNLDRDPRGWLEDMKCNHFLYRHFDSEGNLLYVGISLSAMDRLRQHKKCSCWFKEITFITIEKFRTRSEAEKAEKFAIETEEPLYNKAHVISLKEKARMERRMIPSKAELKRRKRIELANSPKASDFFG